MAKLRLIHNQTVTGSLLINDIDQGLPVKNMDERRKQEVYVTYHKKAFNGLTLEEDITIPGFIDLVLSDKVKLSRAQGVIKGLEDAGMITVLDLEANEAAPPVITSATQDRVDGSDLDNSQVVITGTGFLSTNPYTSSIVLINDAGLATTLSRDFAILIGNTFTDTQIIFNFGSATIIETVAVIAEGVRVEFPVSPL